MECCQQTMGMCEQMMDKAAEDTPRQA